MIDHLDILGHRRALSRLWQSLSRDQLHHAYLFEGPQGVGKRRVAHRLAQASNCTHDGPRPCLECSTCRAIEAHHHPDVIEVVPDPNRASRTIAVPQIREVIRTSSYHRYQARRRVVIIDPAEAMNEAAANALLKTLEEPPEGTGFILIATTPSALLPTIRSRCQAVRFGAVSETELTTWLRTRGLEEPELAARLALGCPGAALSLDQDALAARRARRDEVLQMIGADLTTIFAWSGKLASGQRAKWSRSFLEILDILEDLLRDVTVRGSGSDLPLFNADAPDLVERWTQALWPDGVVNCVRAVELARSNLDHNVAGKTMVDALLTRLATELGSARKP